MSFNLSFCIFDVDYFYIWFYCGGNDVGRDEVEIIFWRVYGKLVIWIVLIDE